MGARRIYWGRIGVGGWVYEGHSTCMKLRGADDLAGAWDDDTPS